jgi:membrane protein implicated in regulation of membrane protease activity
VNIVLVLIALFSVIAGRLAPSPRKGVTVRDSAGRGVENLTIQALANGDGRVLVDTTTNARGEAVLQKLSVDQERIRVEGALPTGVPLHLTGNDAEGILVLLGTPPNRLDLLVDPTGLVVLDPRQFVREPSGARATSISVQPNPSLQQTVVTTQPSSSPVAPATTATTAATTDTAVTASTGLLQRATDWLSLLLLVVLSLIALHSFFRRREDEQR